MNIDECIKDIDKTINYIEKNNLWYKQFGVYDYLDFMAHYATKQEWNLYNKYKSSWNKQLFKTFERVLREISEAMDD